MAFNTAADVRRVLHIDTSNEILTDTEIDVYLAEANSDLFSEIKRKFENQDFDIVNDKDGVLVDRYSLTLAPVTLIQKVLINNILLDSGSYSLDSDTGEIVITAGISNGDVMKVFYQPVVYDLAELYLCAYNINISTNLLNRGGNENPIADNIERKKNQYLDVIMSRVIFAAWK